MKKIILIFLGVLFFGGLGILGIRKIKSQIKTPLPTDKKIHYHAGFVVFNNGKKLDFSDSKYMFVKPCTVDGKEIEADGDEQIEKAHLHDNVGNLVHVEAKDAKWGDLFANINFPIDYAKTTAYINGRIIPNFEQQQIGADESLVLFIGKVNTKLLSQGVTKDYIETQAAKSGPCSD